jgi:uncharacterized integral membrane protein
MNRAPHQYAPGSDAILRYVSLLQARRKRSIQVSRRTRLLYFCFPEAAFDIWLSNSISAYDHYSMRNLKFIAASVLAILMAILVVQNTEPVETHLLSATVAMPHAVLIFISAAAGFVLGVLLTMSLRSKRKITQ